MRTQSVARDQVFAVLAVGRPSRRSMPARRCGKVWRAVVAAYRTGAA